MKKHNESKSIKGIRRSKGKILCKVISFTMIFVMLFCISATAEMKNITVSNQLGNDVTIEANITITERTTQIHSTTTKIISIETEQVNEISYHLYMNDDYELDAYINEKSNGIEVLYEDLVVNIISNTNRIESGTGEIIISKAGGATPEEIYTKWKEIIQPLENNDFSEYITIYQETPEYVSFLDKARALFGLLWEMVTDTFNWLVSPTVIPFFLIGTALSLLFIGIIICKRLFWGR